MGSNGSKDAGEHKPHSSGGLDDTVPASEPPLDVHGQPMRNSRASIPPVTHERYRLGIELGRGGMGRVVEAFDTQLGRTVALKEVLPKGPSIARRFLREVEITARLEHASIVPLYDAGTSADGRPFYVMRRVSGHPLDEAIKRARGLGERLMLLPAVLAAIDAVAHAHKRGIIHRDIKPANILVGELGETVVIDWGLAKVIGEEDDETMATPAVPTAADSLQTQAGAVFGTPGFMSPEQARGEPLSTRSDVFALGATLYYLLAGSPPHAGDSATIVLGRTLKHDVVPLVDAAPGAPPDLVTIVNKALAFDAEDRYPNAGALSDDVRRFLGGQLVAAHRYTPQQRMRRFAKRHRTSLAIAAFAAVAVAGLAWFSVHRILQERDLADAASKEALAEKRLAEIARDSLAERNDALLLTQARFLLESNPTEALAVVKQLPPGSVRLPEGRAIAQAAVARGVWWAMQSTEEATSRIEMSPDGQQLLQVTRNTVRIWDLERRRLVIARQYPTPLTAVWVDRGQVLVFGSARVAEILDPSANVSTPLPFAPFDDVDVSDNGERLLVTDKNGVASWFESGTPELTPLVGGRSFKSIEIAPEGTWGVLSDDKVAIAVDETGKELIRVTGEPLRIVASRYRTFAVAMRNKLVECTLDPTPSCTELGSPITPRPMVIDISYRGRELMMYAASGDVIGWSGGNMSIRGRSDQFMGRLTEVADEVLVVPSFTGKLLLLGRNLSYAMHLPVPVSHARIVARPKHSRIVIVGDGQILVAELESVIPRRLPDTGNSEAVFADDKTLLVTTSTAIPWSWIDIATGVAEPVSAEAHGFPFILGINEGRVLIFDERGEQSRLVVLERGKPLIKIIDGVFPWGHMLPGGTVLFGAARSRDGTTPGDGRVFVGNGSDEPRELVKLDGEVISTTPLGPDRFAALSSRGELVRGNYKTGEIERGNVDTGKVSFIANESRGRALIAIDDRLLLWDSAPYEIARFPDVLRTIARGDGGRALVTLMNNDVYIISLEANAKPERLLNGGQAEPLSSNDGATLVASGGGRQLTIVELASANRWTLPMMLNATTMLAIAPTSRQIVQGTYAGLMVWTLPTASKDLPGWLDEQSNAVKIGDHALAWPWQVRAP